MIRIALVSLTLLALVPLAPADARAFRAKLVGASWNVEAGIPEDSEVSDDGRVLTTTFPAGPAELVAHATLEYDVSRGTDGILQFLSSHSWMKCEAPDGLIVGESGRVPVVCTPVPDKLARIRKKTRVTIKADPPGGGMHRKIFWVLVPTTD